MATEFSIDADTGNLRLGLVVLTPRQSRASVEPQVAGFRVGSNDHGNGYAWLHLGGLTFGGPPAFLSLCFHNRRLTEASWAVQLAGATAEGGWPTREAIDDELAFVREALKTMGLRTGRTTWGEVWSTFDPKGFLAANGLRYA
jgi:hypothetical protein